MRKQDNMPARNKKNFCNAGVFTDFYRNANRAFFGDNFSVFSNLYRKLQNYPKLSLPRRV